jgi:RNA polymerase sigma-70 factor, ECF subfamily
MSREAQGPSDAEAIRKVLSGETDAFRTLVERYQGRIHRLALRVLRDEEAARDATQESFLKAFAALARFRGQSSFYTWLYRLALNQCLDQRRRDRSGREVEWTEGGAVERELNESPPSEAMEVEHAPAAAVLRKELRLRIAEAIERLPAGARETLILREVDGLSYAEIAAALAIPKGTVMSRLHYARRQVQGLLREAGVTVPAGAGPGAGRAPGAQGEDDG